MKAFHLDTFYKEYKELILLIVGFVLTGIIGSTLTFYYQERAQTAALQFEQLRSERTSATQTATDISELIGKHHFNALSLRGAIETYINDPTPENLTFLNEQSANYRTTVREWNTEWNKNRARLRMDFGSDFEARFYTHSDISKTRYEHSLTGLFNDMHGELVKAKAVALSKDKKKQFDFTKFDQDYDAIGYLSYQFYNDMIKEIQAGNIGTFNKKPLEILAPMYVFPSVSPTP